MMKVWRGTVLLTAALTCSTAGAVLFSVNIQHAKRLIRIAEAGLPLPAVLMGADYPLNQPIADLPADTRELTTGASQAPIDAAFRKQYGGNRLHFDCTMPITVVDTVKTPYIIIPVEMTKSWGNDDASAVPILGANIELGEDHHVLIYDMATGLGHELFSVETDHNITYSAAMYRRWDFTHGEVGAPGKNSADAAGHAAPASVL